MAGAFSGHLVNSFYANQAQVAPFSSITSPSQIITSGAMSFNPHMHGNISVGHSSMAESFSFNSQPSFLSELSEATTLKIAALQAKLNQKLGPEYISQRPGPGGGPKLTYAEGWKIINLANEVFGFNGWSSNVVSLTTDFIDFNEESRRYTVGTTAIIRVTLRDGVHHEDIGYGMLENSRSKGAALDKCKKEAVTDGLKRALRNFGNLLGNCLYDKSYTQEVIKIKVPPAKFNKNELHRRPEYDESKLSISSTSASTSNPPMLYNSGTNDTMTPIRPTIPQPQQPTSVLSSVPSHMRSEARPSVPTYHNNPAANKSITPSTKSKPTGLNTPITTPAQAPAPITTRPPPPAPDYGRKARPPTVSTGDNTNTSNKPVTSAGGSKAQTPPPQSVLAGESGMNPVEADESFNFSDDDAFLALVDLGEGDLGQPILPDVDIGRPIGDDEDYGDFGRPIDLEEGLGEIIYEGHEYTYADARTGSSEKSGPTDSTIQPQDAGTGMLSRLLPQQQNKIHRQQQQRPQPEPHRVAESSSSSSRPQHPRSIQDQRQSRPPNQNDSRVNHQDQVRDHRPVSIAQPTASTSGSTKPSTPSMGGFNFPPGVNPNLQQTRGQSRSSGSAIGLKRPLDAMSGSSTTATRRRPGMGLDMHGEAGAGQTKREVFGVLDVGDGGDVKRMRR